MHIFVYSRVCDTPLLYPTLPHTTKCSSPLPYPPTHHKMLLPLPYPPTHHKMLLTSTLMLLTSTLPSHTPQNAPHLYPTLPHTTKCSSLYPTLPHTTKCPSLSHAVPTAAGRRTEGPAIASDKPLHCLGSFRVSYLNRVQTQPPWSPATTNLLPRSTSTSTCVLVF